ncbi:hypothetical protein [Thalassomonas sp. RHCl1]|uniref:hypothetical protein n=1 Tax=Thalassomonas sp. RHCl1 TaxID=2995320 RepID=UPI00248BBA11|nr:hypothetical protein [Thalassomonas sp. RHCl1]
MQIAEVDFLPSNPPRVNEFSVSFMDEKHYWSILAYEFEQQQQPYLLKGLNKASASPNIARTIVANYKDRLEKEMFYLTKPIESFPVSISGIAGEGHMFDAVFAASQDKRSDLATNERFVLWVITKDGQIFVGKLHILVEGKTPSVRLTKTRLNQFMATCSFI